MENRIARFRGSSARLVPGLLPLAAAALCALLSQTVHALDSNGALPTQPGASAVRVQGDVPGPTVARPGPSAPAAAGTEKPKDEGPAGQWRAALVALGLLAAIVFFVLELRRKTATLDALEVPKALAERGYTGSVLARWILDHVHRVQKQAKVQRGEYAVEFGAAQVDVQVPGANLSLRAALRFLRQVIGRPEMRIGGELYETGKRLGMRLRTNDGKATAPLPTRMERDLEPLVSEAAEALLLLIDPYLIVQYWFHKEERQGRFDKTLDLVRFCLANTEPRRHKRAYLAWGNVLTAQSLFDDAIAKFKLALEIDPNFAPAYNGWGTALRKQRQFEDAADKFREAIRRDGGNLAARNNLANTEVDRRRFKEAIDIYQDVIRRKPGNAFAHGNLGNVYRHRFEYDRAWRHLERSIELDPDWVWSHIQMAQLLRQMRRIGGARAELARAADLDPRIPNIQGVLGDLFADEGEFDAALKKHEAALQLDPAYPFAPLARSRILREQRRFAEARAALDPLRSRPVMDPQVNVQLGWILLQEGRNDAAARAFEKAAGVSQVAVDALLGWSYALRNSANARRADNAAEAQELYRAAILKLEVAINLEPFCGRAYRAWAELLLQLGDVDGAHAKADRAIALDPYDVDALATMGSVFRRAGKFDEAIVFFDRAHTLAPRAAWPLSGWGDVLEAFARQAGLEPHQRIALLKEALAKFEAARAAAPFDERVQAAIERVGQQLAAVAPALPGSH